jgi:uncharacterized membrane protein YraQ (UPF0718 family)
MKIDAGTIYLIVAFLLLLISALKDINKTKKALVAAAKISLNIFPILFLIFTLMGLIEALVSREMMATWLGTGKGARSILIGELLGCFALVQPAAVFPFAGFLHDKGANYGAVLGFVMTAILIGISTLPLEIKMFGKHFTLVRNFLTLIFTFFIGILFIGVLS